MKQENQVTHSTTNTAARELLPTPCGWVRTKNDRYELRIGKEMPPDRSNGNAGPWVAIFDTPSVLAALTDAIDNRHMPVVTDAMVKRGIAGYEAAWERHEAKRGSGSMAFETLVRAALTEALTQQQDGEQEAGEVDDEMVERACKAAHAQYGTEWDDPGWDKGNHRAKFRDAMRATLTAAFQAGSP